MSAKTVLITGAADGLGRGVAEALADQGHTLLLHGRSQERLDAVAGTLDATVRPYRADLASLRAVGGPSASIPLSITSATGLAPCDCRPSAQVVSTLACHVSRRTFPKVP